MNSSEILRSLSGFFNKILHKDLQSTLADFRKLMLIAVNERPSYTSHLLGEGKDNKDNTESKEPESFQEVIAHGRKELEKDIASKLPDFPEFMQLKHTLSYQEYCKVHNSLLELLYKGNHAGIWEYQLSDIAEYTYMKVDKGYRITLPSGLRVVFSTTFDTYYCPDPLTYTTHEHMSDHFTHDYIFLTLTLPDLEK